MPGKIKLLVYLAVWKRPEITEICFAGIDRLRGHKDYEIIPFAIISEPEIIPLCEKYGVLYEQTINLPIGRKKNVGLKMCRRMDFDWMMEIGSDTLILNELLDDYKTIKEDFFGVSDVAFIDMDSGACKRMISRNTLFGAGRMIKRSVLEKMDFNLWPDKLNRGLDNGSVYAVGKQAKVTYRKTYPLDSPMVVELKSQENLWPYKVVDGVDYPVVNVLKKLSDKENELIRCYRQKLTLAS